MKLTKYLNEIFFLLNSICSSLKQNEIKTIPPPPFILKKEKKNKWIVGSSTFIECSQNWLL